jgi:hypothetical protein
MIINITISRGNGATGPPKLQTHQAHARAVHTLVTTLKPWRNWYLDLSNERNLKDQRFTSIEELAQLRRLARDLDPARLVTASDASDPARATIEDYLNTVGLDFITIHRPRHAGSPAQTEARCRQVLGWMKEIGREVPLHYGEPFRRDFGNWNPTAQDFIADLQAARAAGAAGWCFHNGHTRDTPGHHPRRSFDLRQKRLFDQLDEQEMKFMDSLGR